MQMADATGNTPMPTDSAKVANDLEWWVPADVLPEGNDDPWRNIEFSGEPDLYPIPAGYP
jgi:hypothetical protein